MKTVLEAPTPKRTKIFFNWVNDVMTREENEESDNNLDNYREFGVRESDFF